MRLLKRFTPTLLTDAWEREEPREARAPASSSSAAAGPVEIALVLGERPPESSDVWTPRDGLAGFRIVVSLAERPSIAPSARRNVFLPFQNKIPAEELYCRGIAIRCRVEADPRLEAERVRRILSLSAARFVEEGWTRAPETLVWGSLAAMRLLPRGLADWALLPGDDCKKEDLEIARGPILWLEKPREAAPALYGPPVAVGPEIFWRSSWLSDPLDGMARN